MKRGTLIAVCGIDGSGKTTQLARLRQYLEARSAPVVTTRQPTDRYRRDPVVRAALNLEIPFDEVGRARVVHGSSTDGRPRVRSAVSR
jgi:dTMP kinase